MKPSLNVEQVGSVIKLTSRAVKATKLYNESENPHESVRPLLEEMAEIAKSLVISLPESRIFTTEVLLGANGLTANDLEFYKTMSVIEDLLSYVDDTSLVELQSLLNSASRELNN